MNSRFDRTDDRKLVCSTAHSFSDAANALGPLDKHFVAMLVCDASMSKVSDISSLARQLINAGCSYFCCWGADCERVHDIFDEGCVGDGSCDVSDDTIMTTWHSSDTIEEFIAFSLLCTNPSKSYRATTNTTVAIVIDDQTSAHRIQLAFDNPTKFLAEHNN